MLKPSLVSLERKVGAMVNSELAILTKKLNQKDRSGCFLGLRFDQISIQLDNVVRFSSAVF